MDSADKRRIEAATQAALEVLHHNARGPFRGLPRTAGWGYPEPYTRDLMISMLGIAASEDAPLMATLRRVLESLARNQSVHGHIPSLVHDPEDRGSSDTTPLFLVAVAIYRKASGEAGFLGDAVGKALTWMQYQSPSDRYLAAQQPTSDWRDEQWVLGSGLYVNAILYCARRLHGQLSWAQSLKQELRQPINTGGRTLKNRSEGLSIKDKPYFAFWSHKVYSSRRFDLLGNSWAILGGLASRRQATRLIDWVEAECGRLRSTGDLVGELPPNFFPFVLPSDPDWYPRYQRYNRPGDYHNGGIWPFVGGFYVAALVAAGKYRLAELKLLALTELVSRARKRSLDWGFNEWMKAQTGEPMGQDWQTWSAAMYLFAAESVRRRRVPFFGAL